MLKATRDAPDFGYSSSKSGFGTFLQIWLWQKFQPALSTRANLKFLLLVFVFVVTVQLK